MRFYQSIIFFLFGLSVFAQKDSIDFNALDSLYREDQFYIGLTFNKLQNAPKELIQNKFSPGFFAGFIRDMPINKTRTWAIGIGLGYSFNNYNTNLFITESTSSSSSNNYDFDTTVSYDKNKLSLHYIELPLEIRWRNSTPESHIFWRIYTGFKLSYLVYDKYKFSSQETAYKIIGNKDLNKLLYGFYIAAGRNTWNAYAYYGINPIFKSAKTNGNPIELNTFNLGLMFYIL
ncbi:porin family protein [Flavobacterium sp.]|uniref:porin family protein n=1 Tax=Flavobacterium sp. TaxID=239 RepID=UPI0037517B4A